MDNSLVLRNGPDVFVDIYPPIEFDPARSGVVVPHGSRVFVRNSLSLVPWSIDQSFLMRNEGGKFIFNGKAPAGLTMEYKFFIVPSSGQSFWYPSGENEKNYRRGILEASANNLQVYQSDLSLAREALATTVAHPGITREMLIFRADRLIPQLRGIVEDIRRQIGETSSWIIHFANSCQTVSSNNASIGLSIDPNTAWTLMTQHIDNVPHYPETEGFRTALNCKITQIHQALCLALEGIPGADDQERLAIEKGHPLLISIFQEIKRLKEASKATISHKDSMDYGSNDSQYKYWSKALVDWLELAESQYEAEVSYPRVVASMNKWIKSLRSKGLDTGFPIYLYRADYNFWARRLVDLTELLFKPEGIMRGGSLVYQWRPDIFATLRGINLEVAQLKKSHLDRHLSSHFNEVMIINARVSTALRTRLSRLEYEEVQFRQAIEAILAAIST